MLYGARGTIHEELRTTTRSSFKGLYADVFYFLAGLVGRAPLVEYQEVLGLIRSALAVSKGWLRGIGVSSNLFYALVVRIA